MLDGHSTWNNVIVAIRGCARIRGINRTRARTQSAYVAVHKTRSTKKYLNKTVTRDTCSHLNRCRRNWVYTPNEHLPAGVSLHVPNGRRVLVWDHDHFARILCVEPTTQLAQTSPNSLLCILVSRRWASGRKTRLEVETFK